MGGVGVAQTAFLNQWGEVMSDQVNTVLARFCRDFVRAAGNAAEVQDLRSEAFLFGGRFSL